MGESILRTYNLPTFKGLISRLIYMIVARMEKVFRLLWGSLLIIHTVTI